MKKVIKFLPYIFMLIITPFYNILDDIIFVEVFGCGCVPIAQTNMFNIDFNANDLRRLVYGAIAISMCILGIILAKNIESKKMKATYVITIAVFNIILAIKICQICMWM